MANCWTCGTQVSGYRYTCSSCQSLDELKTLEKNARSHAKDVSNNLDYIAHIQQEGFSALSDALSTGLSEIASAIEWGFGEISWQLQQQTDVLRSIDCTLKTPSETQANEWRLHAEELRRRGVLEESEEFFLRALNEYRLDYRIYVGLAETYLRMNKFDKARTLLERSLPHAPTKEIDYRSYSYRLIGHICACEGDYNQAVSVLQTSIELSPTYEDGHYDYAQYCAQAGDKVACVSSLQKAILAKPLYWYLAQKERNFGPLRNEVDGFLSNISTEASRQAKGVIDKADEALDRSREAVTEARGALSVSKSRDTLSSGAMCEEGDAKLKLARDKLALGDYVAFLEAKRIAEESYASADNALTTAKREKEHYIKTRSEKVKNAWNRAPGALLGWPLLYGIMGGIGGSILDLFSGPRSLKVLWGLLLGILYGLIRGIQKIQKELQ